MSATGSRHRTASWVLGLVVVTVAASACSGAKQSSTSQSRAPAATSVAPTTGTTTSTTVLLSSDPVAGVAGEPPAAPAEQHGLVAVPSFPDLVRYEGTQDVQGMQVVALTAGRVVEGEPFFAPTILVGSPNQRVVLRISNTSPVTHNFTLDAEHLNTLVPDGHTVDITVQFPTSGVLVFYCKIHSKDQQGGALYTVA